jgi:hypothetical protein
MIPVLIILLHLEIEENNGDTMIQNILKPE